MTLKQIPWARFLGPEPPLAPDVTFIVVEGESPVGELRAHKHLLASISLVFRKQFFGKLAEPRKEILIKETTFRAFQFLLQYIYCGLEVTTLIEQIQPTGTVALFFEILNLAEKYDMKPLIAEISQVFKDTWMVCL